MGLGNIPVGTVRSHYALMVEDPIRAIVDRWSGQSVPAAAAPAAWSLTRAHIRDFLSGHWCVAGSTAAGVLADGLELVSDPDHRDELIVAYLDRSTARVRLGLLGNSKTFLLPAVQGERNRWQLDRCSCTPNQCVWTRGGTVVTWHRQRHDAAAAPFTPRVVRATTATATAVSVATGAARLSTAGGAPAAAPRPRCACTMCDADEGTVLYNQRPCAVPRTARQFMRAAHSSALLGRWRAGHHIIRAVPVNLYVSLRHFEPWALASVAGGGDESKWLPTAEFRKLAGRDPSADERHTYNNVRGGLLLPRLEQWYSAGAARDGADRKRQAVQAVASSVAGDSGGGSGGGGGRNDGSGGGGISSSSRSSSSSSSTATIGSTSSNSSGRRGSSGGGDGGGGSSAAAATAPTRKSPRPPVPPAVARWGRKHHHPMPCADDEAPNECSAGVDDMASAWLAERAATRRLLDELLRARGTQAEVVDEVLRRVRELHAGTNVDGHAATVKLRIEDAVSSGFSRATMSSPRWINATISKSAGAGRPAMTRCRMFYGFRRTEELFAYVPRWPHGQQPWRGAPSRAVCCWYCCCCRFGVLAVVSRAMLLLVSTGQLKPALACVLFCLRPCACSSASLRLLCRRPGTSTSFFRTFSSRGRLWVRRQPSSSGAVRPDSSCLSTGNSNCWESC